VVVVESNAAGGSMLTVAAATARDRPVLAVPGPVRSPASAGTNALLADGCAPARDAADVLVALGLHVAAPAAEAQPERPDGVDGEVLEAVDWGPTTLDVVVARSGVDVARAASALIRLEVDGWVRGDGGWWERQKPPGRRLHSVSEGA
jgi:DNA processing protein